MRVGLDLQRHPFDDLQPEALEATELRWVVGHQLHRRDAEVGEDLCADAVLAAVGRQPQLEVGVDGVVALVLQAIRTDLVADSDAAAFVAPQVHDRAAIFLGDLLQCGGQLRSALTAQ